jgi:thiol-disulfide isomerase/thioredoxin
MMAPLYLYKYNSTLKKQEWLGCVIKISCAICCLLICVPFYAICQDKSPSDHSAPIPSFLINDAYGHKTDAAGQKGKVVFINFWALTCVPCKAEMPTISRLGEHYKDDTNFRIFPVDLDRNFRDDLPYFTSKNISLNVYAPSGVVPSALFKGELPTTVILDKDGQVAFFKAGQDNYDTLPFYRLIDSLLKK